MDYVIGLLNDRLSTLEDGYKDLVINGDVKETSDVAIQNRDRVSKLKLAISALAKKPDASESTLPIDIVTNRRELFDNFYKWYDSLTVAESDEHSLTSAIEEYFFKIIK